MAYEFTFTHRFQKQFKKLIILIDVGHHDILKQF